MYAIRIQSYFSAAHNLRGYRGRCEKLHGHNWKVEAELACSRLDHLAMVCDFKELKKKLGNVLKKLDHTCLDKVAYFKKHNPTSENIAEFIYLQLKKSIKGKNLILRSITVWENRDSCAIFSPFEKL